MIDKDDILLKQVLMKQTTRLRSHAEHSPLRYRTTWQRHLHCIPRWARIFFVAVVFFFAGKGLFRGVGDLQDQWTKLGPTDFNTLSGSNNFVRPPERPVRNLAEGYIDDRYLFMRHLGAGQEGAAALYVDMENGDTVVLKTFNVAARNTIPPELTGLFSNYTTTWPSEIEAGLSLGTSPQNASYVPVLDYFITQSKDSWSWTIVFPFISGGTLVALAAHERASHPRSPDSLDHTFRSKFIDIVDGLALLHDAEMCHDDIKSDNIFIDSSSNWLLGDLGNLRHASHSWHHTRSWVRQNQWSDCRVNDLRRALKTYLWFLRSACEDVALFDQEFWDGRKPWSRIYWEFVREVGNGRQPTAQEIVDAEKKAEGFDDGDGLERIIERFGTIEHRSRATERELICTTIPKRLWKWWWWFGIP